MVTGKESTFKNAVRKIAVNYACEEDMPIYCGEMKLPDRKEVVDILNEIERILFPAYFGVSTLRGMTAPEFVEKTLISIYYQLKTQLELSLSLSKCTNVKRVFKPDELDNICDEFINELPNLQEMLLKDVTANYEGDPAAMSKSEIVLSYPGFYAIFVYRIAHELYKRKVPFVPRMMTEYAHGKTGIDINPGAEIGEYFFIDHGTGIVIGETTVIGKWVKIY